MPRIAAVAGEIDTPSLGLDHIAAPHAPLPGERPPRGEMLRGHERDFQSAGERERVPPIELAQIGEAERTENARVTGCSEHAGREALPQPAQCGYVEMVVMIMAEQDEIDLRQIVKRHAGPADALWAHAAKWTGALRPDRVGKERGAAGLDQERNMI